ncbi:MAG: response regulator transcription factor [Candidatus Eiseniibacteriota bacterium]
MKVLVVDDDLELLGLISYALRQSGYLVVEAADGRAALEVYDRERPNLVLLDHNLPHLSGIEVLRTLRARGERTPVMMLTVRSAEEDQVRALDCGADDYLTKPFSPRTVLARVRALLRRTGTERAAKVDAGDFALDAEARTVSIRNRAAVTLTPLEFRLLQLLVANADHVLTVDRITAHVWGYRGLGDRQLLKQLVRRLRRKIEDDPSDPRYLLSQPGAGYRLSVRG